MSDESPSFVRVPISIEPQATPASPIVGRRKIDLPDIEPETPAPTGPVFTRRSIDIASIMAEANATPEPAKPQNEIILKETPLPAEYQRVLEEIRPDAPQEWKDQAREAAYFFWSLDQGLPLKDAANPNIALKVNRMAQQYAESDYISTYFVKFLAGDIVPETALPAWVIERRKATNHDTLSPQELTNIANAYEQYGQQYGQVYLTRDKQKHYNYTVGAPPETFGGRAVSTDNYKMYIENGALKDPALVFDTIKKLAEPPQVLHPHSTKLFEGDRLVLYWHCQLTQEQKDEINKIFDNSHLHIRGFAQDPIQLRYKPDSDPSIEVRTSNDGALGAHNVFTHDLVSSYSPESFFKKYLQICFHGCKDPSEPYNLSFIPFVTGEVATTDEKVVTQVGKTQEAQRLPLYKTQRTYLNVFP